jgi:hypothetical protein
MDEKTDWEKKEIRIAWESITKSLCEVQAALIQSGNVKFKNLAEAMQDIDMSRQVEFAEFLNVGGNLSFHTSSKPAPVELSITPQAIPVEKKYSDVHCIDCDRKLTLKELDFIKKTGRENLCYQCDKKRQEKIDE